MRLGITSSAILSLLSFGLVSAQTTREQFVSLAASHGGIIKLNDKTFDAITAPGRDWSVAIQMTALHHSIRCEPCLAFAPSFDAIASAWKKVPKDVKDYHFFATLDFKDGQDVFRRLGLSSAPFVHFYPATSGHLLEAHPSTAMWTYDFNSHAFDADTLARELSPHTPVPIPYTKPFNWTPVFTAFALAAGLFGAYQMFGSVILGVLTSRYVWGIGCLAFIVTMLGGFMFTRIRAAPYAGQARGPNGMPQISYISGGYQQQFGAEVQLVAAMYSVLAASNIALIVYAPKLPTAGRQRASIYIWLAATWMLFSVLVAVFKLKHAAYPFKLLL